MIDNFLVIRSPYHSTHNRFILSTYNWKMQIYKEIFRAIGIGLIISALMLFLTETVLIDND